MNRYLWKTPHQQQAKTSTSSVATNDTEASSETPPQMSRIAALSARYNGGGPVAPSNTMGVPDRRPSGGGRGDSRRSFTSAATTASSTNPTGDSSNTPAASAQTKGKRATTSGASATTSTQANQVNSRSRAQPAKSKSNALEKTASQTENTSIRVCLRFRPMNDVERRERSRNCVKLHRDPGTSTCSSVTVMEADSKHSFSFDRVFGENSTQSSVFDYAASPLVADFLAGKNCCLLAYGQTGSGKTHTMMGQGLPSPEGIKVVKQPKTTGTDTDTGGGTEDNEADDDDEETEDDTKGSKTNEKDTSVDSKQARKDSAEQAVAAAEQLNGSDKDENDVGDGGFFDEDSTISSISSCGASEVRQTQQQPPPPVHQGPPPTQVITKRRIRKPPEVKGTERTDAAAPPPTRSAPPPPRTSSSITDTTPKVRIGSRKVERESSGDVKSPSSEGKRKTFSNRRMDPRSGIIPRIIRQVFSSIPNEQLEAGMKAEENGSNESGDNPEDQDMGERTMLRCSYVEIYLEKIHDLLMQPIAGAATNTASKTLTIREDSKTGDVYLEDSVEEACGDEMDVYRLLERGNVNRTTAETQMNADSSRSHAVFILKLERYMPEKATTVTSRLFLVDLAGSEMASKTGVRAGTQAMQEAKMINKSLSALGNVILALTTNNRSHVPYRDSKLTRLLQNSLGGNSKTSLVITASASSYNVVETLSTIRFGQRAKKVVNKVAVNNSKAEDRSVEWLKSRLAFAEKRNDELMAQMEKLRRELQEAKEKLNETGTELIEAQKDLATTKKDLNEMRAAQEAVAPPKKLRPSTPSLSEDVAKKDEGTSCAAPSDSSKPTADGKPGSSHPSSPRSPVESKKTQTEEGHAVSSSPVPETMKDGPEESSPFSGTGPKVSRPPLAKGSELADVVFSIETTPEAAAEDIAKKTGESGAESPQPSESIPAKELKGVATKEASENGTNKSDIESSDPEFPLSQPPVLDHRIAMDSGVGGSSGSRRPSQKTVTDKLPEPVKEVTGNHPTVESLKRATKRVGDELATAKEELRDVSTSIKRASLRVVGRDEKIIATPLSSRNEGVDAAASRIEEELAIARAGLDGIVKRVSDDKFEDFEQDLLAIDGNGANDRAMHELKKKALLASALSKDVQALQRENAALTMMKKKRDDELTKARKEIKVLALRASEAENNLRQARSRQENDRPGSVRYRLNSTSQQPEENAEVSNIVGNGLRSSESALAEKQNIDKEHDDEDTIIAYPNRPQEGSSTVTVCLRLRPMSKLEASRRSRRCVEVHDGGQSFTVESPLDGEYDFWYDQVFDTHASQREVFEFFGPSAVSNVVAGINSCVIVYGLNGSGKSHTMFGDIPDSTISFEQDRPEHMSDSAGLVPRCLEDLFREMEGRPSTVEFVVRCSYIALHFEQVFDLLEAQVAKTLTVTETPTGVHVEGATEACCFDVSDALALLKRGQACQAVLSSRRHMDILRQHSAFIVKVEQRDLETGVSKVATLKFVDMAGCDMSIKSKGQNMYENKLFLRSFSALGNVVKALTENSTHAPYRESKLTCLLKDGLGGNCNTTFIITASPSTYSMSETIHPIRLGQRVRRIVNTARINTEVDIAEYKKWLLSTEVKFGELLTLMKEVWMELLAQEEEGNGTAPKLSGPLWDSISSLIEDDSEDNFYRQAIHDGNIEEVTRRSSKWQALSTEFARLLRGDELTFVEESRDRAESLLSGIQSEVAVLRRQNDLLVQDRKKKEIEVMDAKTELKSITLKLSETEYKLGISVHRDKEATMLLRCLRKLCWKLQKNMTKSRARDIEKLSSILSDAPDLTGLVDLDRMMLDSGFIESIDVSEEEDEEGDEIVDLQASHEAMMKTLRRHAIEAGEIDGKVVERDSETTAETETETTAGNLSVNDLSRAASVPAAHFLRNSLTDPAVSTTRSLSGMEAHAPLETEREHNLRRDLRNVTNKCVELQMLLSEERDIVNALTNRTGSLSKNKLAQEAIALRKERDTVMDTATAATWKLQELQVVNKALSKKAEESREQVSFLEEGFQKLQETFRKSVLEAVESESKLSEKVVSLEAVVESLTVPQVSSGPGAVDALSRPAPRMNIPIRGRMIGSAADASNRLASFSSPSSTPSGSSPQPLRLLPSCQISLKRLRKSPAVPSRQKAKFHRPSKKTGDAIGGVGREKLHARARLLRRKPMLPFRGDVNFMDRTL